MQRDTEGCEGMRGVSVGCSDVRRDAEGCSAARRDTKGCSAIRGDANGCKGMQGVSVGCKGLQRDAESCKRSRRTAVRCKGTQGIAMGRRRLQWDTTGCKRSQRDAKVVSHPCPWGGFGTCVCSLPISPHFNTAAPCRHGAARWRHGAGAVLGRQCPPAPVHTAARSSPQRSAAGVCSRAFRAERSERPNPGAPFAPRDHGDERGGEQRSFMLHREGGGGEKTPILPTLPLRGPEIHVNGLMGTPRARPTAPPAGAER